MVHSLKLPQLEVLGIGDAFSATRYHTSFLIRADHWYLIDGPHSILRLFRERKIPPERVAGILLTHIHGDHVSGVETLLLWRKHCSNTRPRLYTSARVYQEFRDKFFPSFAGSFSPDLQEVVLARPEDYVEFVELREGEVNRLEPSVGVEIRHNWHPAATLGLKLHFPRGKVGISGDTCYRPELLRRLREKGVLTAQEYEKLAGDWLWECDLIYHEVARQGPTSHTLESDLLALPAETRKKLRLVHIADDFVEERLPVAREGERVSFDEQGRPQLDPPAAAPGGG